MIDNLCDDLIGLHATEFESDQRDAVLGSSALAGLPPRFAHKITPHVGRRLLVTAVDLIARLSQGCGRPPALPRNSC